MTNLAGLQAQAPALRTYRALSGTFGGRLSGVGPAALAYAERSRVIPHRRPVPLPPGMCASSRMEMSN